MASGESFYQQLARAVKHGASNVRHSASQFTKWAISTQSAVLHDPVNADIVPDLNQDFEFSKQDFLKACQAISKRLKITNSRFKQLFRIELVDEDNLRMTDKQFDDREIQISIFGRHNCGKSTLLNAILSSKLLPVYIHNETSAVVYIQHDMGRIHRGLCPSQEAHQSLQQGATIPVECQACPKLLVTKGDKTEERVGVIEVYTGLRELNEEIRDAKPPIPDPAEERIHKEGKRKVVGQEEQKSATLEREKGNKFFKKDQFELAVESYTSGMELDPSSAVLPANRAMAFIEMKRYEDAEKDCSTALTLDQDYVKAYYRRGVARRCLGRKEEARKDFLAVLKLEPKNKKAKSELANLEKAISQGNLPLCKLLVSVPALERAPPGWEVLLVDTPGFGEANKRIAQVVDDALKSNTAFLYIMTGDSLGDASDMEYLRQLYETDKEVFTNDRLMIAVTKFDKNVEEEEESLANLEVKIKSKVAKQIRGEFKVSLSEDVIIPVSGLAAFNARCVDERNPDYKKKLVRLLEDYSRSKGQPSGQNEDPSKRFQNIPVAELATELEECCGILQLEERLQVMAKKSVRLWTAKMKADYSQYLMIAEDKLRKASKDSEWSVGGEIKLHQRVTAQTDKVTAILKSVTDGKKSHAYEKLSSAYEEDIKAANPAQRGRDEVPVLVENFKKKCKKRMNDRRDFFGPTEFQQDIQIFCSEAEKELEKVFNSACQLQKLHAAHVECVAESAADCSTMRSEAKRLRDILPSIRKVLAKTRQPPVFQSQPSLPSSESQPMCNPSRSSKQTTDNQRQSESELPSDEASGNEDMSAKNGITKTVGDYLSTEREQPENESHLSTHTTKWLTGGRHAPKTHTPNTAEESSQHGHSESRKMSADNQPPISTHDTSEIPPNKCHNEPQSLAELKEKTHIPAVKLTMWKRFCRFMKSHFTWKESEKSSNNGEKETTPTSDSNPDPAISSTRLPLDKEKFEEEIQSLQDSILEECAQYFQTIKDKVVKYYFDLYCKDTQKRLRAFNADFKNDIDEAVKLLKTLEIHIAKQQTTARELVALELHFNSLHNFLNSELFSKVYIERNVQT